MTGRPRLRGLAALATCVTLAACATGPDVEPASYDPEGSTRTSDRPIEDVHRRTIGFLDDRVWISNEFPGARANDVWREGDSVLVVRIRPENAPINNSAWYGFKIWSDVPRQISLRLTYEDGRHRYRPMARRSGEPWERLPDEVVEPDTAGTGATLRLTVSRDTLWVAGQELFTSRGFERWVDSLSALPYVSSERIGTSRRGRPLRMLTITEDPASTDHVFLISRQHPPEVTGTWALLGFVAELAGDTPLAQRFRRNFQVRVVPIVNPDGVDLGHWRHNTGGVDLNRDWVAFNQPETSAVRDALLSVGDRPGHRVWFAADFHSTRRDVFYTLNEDHPTNPPGFLDQWLDGIRRQVPGYEINEDPSSLGSPTSSRWFYHTFGEPPAITYEVGDHTDRALIRDVSAAGARTMMELLLAETGGW